MMNPVGRKRELWLPVPLFGVLALCASLLRLEDPDTWWHLAVGRWMAEQGRFPSTNIFSHTFPDHPWQYTEWLFGLLLSRIHAVSGYPGLSLLQSLLTLGLCVAVALTAARRAGGASPWVPWPLLLLFLAACQFRFTLRPELFSLLFLAVLSELWHAGINRRRWLGALFALGIVWGNLHPGMVFGVAFLGVLAFAGALKRKRGEFVRAATGAAALVAGTLINPGFIYPYLYTLQHLWLERTIAINEFARASLMQHPLFYLLAVMACAESIRRLLRRDLTLLLFNCTFLPVACLYLRLIPYYLIAVIPFLSSALTELLTPLPDRKRRALLAGACACAVVAAGWQVAAKTLAPERPLHWGIGAYAPILPRSLVDFMAQHDIGGRLYNDIFTGNLLMWYAPPRSRIFVDGRLQAYPDRFLNDYYRRRDRSGFAGLLDAHGVELAVVRRVYRGDTEVPCEAMHFEALGWPLLYQDGRYLLYVRPDRSARHRQLAFRVFTWERSYDVVWKRAVLEPARAVEELRRLDLESLVTGDDFYCYANGARLAGDGQLAGEIAERGLRRNPDNQGLFLVKAWLLITERRHREANDLLQRIAAAAPGSAYAREAAALLGRPLTNQADGR